MADEFLIDDNISSYYFTTLDERNVYKYTNYKYVAQYQAIMRILRENSDIDTLIFSVQDHNLRDALSHTKNQNSDFAIIDISNSSMISKIRILLHYILNILKGFAYISRVLLWSNLAKFYAKKTHREKNNDITLLSYFPFYDSRAAKTNKFSNLYYFPLQEYLNTEGMKHSWLFMYAQIRGFTYLDSLRIAKRIVQNQYLFLEENISFRDMILVSRIWLQQCLLHI